MNRSPDHSAPPASLARRNFIGVAAAATARLSSIGLPLVLLSGKRADAMGIFPWDDPRHDPCEHDHDHNCLGRGTLVSTVHGEVPVEDLTIGELVRTTSGPLPVKWIGRRTLERGASGSWHPSVVPVRVAQFALDDLTPRRDLYLSQEHSLFIDGFFIPVKYLINGRSITVDHGASSPETIEYFCVELDTHQVMFAEGTAMETFRYIGDRISWDNIDDYEERYGRERDVMAEFAPHCRYKGGRANMGALIRLAASRFVDMRDPIQAAYARIAARANALAA